MAATVRPGSELVQGAGGVDAGVKPELVEERMAKFREGGLNLVRAGGEAGLMSAVIGGWVASGPRGSSPVTKEVQGREVTASGPASTARQPCPLTPRSIMFAMFGGFDGAIVARECAPPWPVI